ncbi:MAG: ParA family protein, partial [Burkholderiaceae bacterium]
MSKAWIFVVVNQKGGVGKTTTAVNTAAAMARAGKRVVLVDLDPQGNATMGCGIDKRGLSRSVYQVLLGLETAQSVRCATEFGFDLLPANRDLAAAELELVDLADREQRLKQAIEIAQEIGDPGGLTQRQINLAQLLFDMQRMEEFEAL